ncbi:MAG: hypothetical protein WEG36_14210 [Gemmatimonadota bacterium]
MPEPCGTSGSARISWARLLARIYEVLPLLCPACGGEMRVLSFITGPPTVQAILLHLALPHRPPPLTPARAPPQAELDFDQTSAFDPSDPEPLPEPDFDQSPPGDWDA